MSNRGIIAALILSAFFASSCSTTRQVLTLERDNLTAIRASETVVASDAANGVYDPARYDAYLFLGQKTLNDVLASLDNYRFTLEPGRPIDIVVNSIRFDFRPGYPSILIDAKATDRKTGIVAGLVMASAVLVESDPQDPAKLTMRLVVSKVAPSLRWGPFRFDKWLFVRRLAQLKALQFADKLPKIDLPVTKDFSIGGPAGEQVMNVPAGDGSMDVRVNWPGTLTKGTIAIKHVLFLRNGIHIFADVEGI